MRPIVRVWCAAAVVFLSLCGVSRVQADSTVPASMANLAGRADVILRGSCVEATPEKMGFRSVVTYTFSVAEVSKGNVPGATFRFSQWAIKGMPSYRVGEEYWLFLTEGAGGLWAPVAFDQGVFKFSRVAGKAAVANGRDNIGLFQGAGQDKAVMKAMSAGGVQPQAAGPMDADAFSTMVKTLVDH